MTTTIPIQSQPAKSGLANSAADEIDFRDVFATMKRQWRWVGAGAAAGLAVGALNISKMKPVYQGEFQILLNNSSGSSAMPGAFSENPALALFSNSASSQIDTEIEVLNSPSVLLPVFKAVQANKPKKVAEDMRFTSWRDSAVTIESKNGTNVLNVEFRDTDKKIIKPITQLLSYEYQKYSNRGRVRELKNMRTYLQQEINKIKPIAMKSNRLAMEFGYANGLGVSDGLPRAGSVSGAGARSQSSNGVGGGGNIEAQRSAAQQRVLALQVQIQEAKRAGNGSIYFASQIANLTDKSSTFDQLTRIEVELAEKQSRFKENDPLVTRLKRMRKTLIQYINQQTIALLNGELDLVTANLKALDRPKEIVSKHRELTQQALRDEATLVNLQNQLQQVKLEQAREGDPWELISTPRVLENSVGPSKKKALLMGLLGGLVIGTGAAIVGERKSGKVFSEDELRASLPGERLQVITSIDHEQLMKSVELLANGPLKKYSSIAIVPIGSIKQTLLNEFCSALEQNLQSKQVLIHQDLSMTRSCETQVLVASPGASTREELRILREQLSLQNTPVAGWILLNPKVSTV